MRYEGRDLGVLLPKKCEHCWHIEDASDCQKIGVLKARVNKCCKCGKQLGLWER